MAASNTWSVTSEQFKMPSEPCPLPSLGSDEESFVVLWKDMDNKYNEDNLEPIGDSIIEEAKQLINKELSQMEKLSLSENVQDSPPTEQVASLKTLVSSHIEEKETRSVPQVEQSTILPKMPQVEKGFDTSDNMISITTISSDLTSEEVQKKVSQIIEENIRLKDTILQNNMSMKSQYERIVAWQEDVQKVHQTHREKIIEAKEFIEKLKMENYNLTRDLEKLKEIKYLQDEELASLKNNVKQKEQQTIEKLLRTSDSQMKEFELDIANKKLKELELSMQNMTVQNTNLKEDREKLIKDVSKINDYEKEIEKLQEALNISKMQIEETKMELLKVRTLEEEKQKSLNEVIESLRGQLFFAAQKQATLPSPEEVTNIRQQLASIQVMLTQVEHSRVAAYAQVEALNKENAELKRQQVSLIQRDEMYALQTQLEVYKADFEAEKNAKETIKCENDKLSEDIQNLQRRNQQLQEEIELLRERDFVVYSNPREHRSRAEETVQSSSNEHTLKCPKCSFGFKTLPALENHVYRCIELDDQLP